MKVNAPALLFAILILTALAGCSSEPNIDTYVQTVKQLPAAPVEPLPDMSLPSPSEYSAQNERDPFYIPPRTGANFAQGQIHPELGRPKEILENFGLDALNMVGTLERKKERWAIILDNSGLIYRATEGSYIGKNHGKIVEITENAIEIVELVPDSILGWRERKARLALDGE